MLKLDKTYFCVLLQRMFDIFFKCDNTLMRGVIKVEIKHKNIIQM
jgi:hypothetical protein